MRASPRPPRFLAAIAVLCLASALARPHGPHGVAAADDARVPRIRFDRTAHDFGPVRQDVEVKTEFDVLNDGNAPLHVFSVKGDCGCALAVISTKDLPPGGRAKIVVVYQTQHAVGPHTKRIHVVSDDPKNPQVDLALTVDVCAGVVLEPAHFFFPMALVGSSPTASVVAKWKEGVGRPFEVRKVTATGADVAFAIEPWASPPWKGHRITMSFRTPPPVGSVSGRATIETSDPDARSVTALIGGAVSGRVFLGMRTASFGILPAGKGGALTMPVSGFDASVNLGQVTAKSKRGVVRAHAETDPGTAGIWLVKVDLPPETAPGEIDDDVEITTEVPGEEIHLLHVTGTVLPPAK